MDSKLRWLSGLLALQLIIAGGLFFNASSATTTLQPKPLLAFEPNRVDRLVVSDGDKEITLIHSGYQWLLPGLQNLPADTVKLDGMLRRLAELKTTWPVTTSKASHERLEVAPDKFARRIDLYAGDTRLDELYLGTSPGFKQVYSRPASDDNVYALALSTYDFPTTAFDWLDKGLLGVNDVTAIEKDQLKLSKSGTQWKLDEPEPDATAGQASVALNTDKVTAITDALADIQVTGVAEQAPDFSSADVVSLTVSGDHDWTYHLLSSDGKYYIKRDDINTVFLISQPEYDSLATVDKQGLLAASAKPATAGEDPDDPPAQPAHPATAGS